MTDHVQNASKAGKWNPEHKARVLAALRSRNFYQGHDTLTRIRVEHSELVEYDCCMGVICKVAEIPKKLSLIYAGTKAEALVWSYGDRVETSTLPVEAVTWLGADSKHPCIETGYKLGDRAAMSERPGDELKLWLAQLNDQLKLTFDQISDLIDWAF